MLDARSISLVAEAAPPLPVAAMVLGKRREEVAELLPRLFNLCRSAQSMAARLALGLPVQDDGAALRAEILRDHVLRLSLVLPGHFGLSPVILPGGWQASGPDLARTIFGPAGRMPDTLEGFESYLGSDTGGGGLLRRISALFGKGEAVSLVLPALTDATAKDPDAAVENSFAARVAHLPLLQVLEGVWGRGPLWRVTARFCDLDALMQGAPLPPRCYEPGVAQVPATRGLYTVMARTSDGRVTDFARVTPTDHLRAPGGILEQTLSTLPATRAALAPLVLDILDPCSPIRIRESADA